MRRILIVDSDPRVCQAIHEILSAIRHVVFFAFDAVRAISEAREHNPDLIIVDLRRNHSSYMLEKGVRS